jgi:acyl dehydratase
VNAAAGAPPDPAAGAPPEPVGRHQIARDQVAVGTQIPAFAVEVSGEHIRMLALLLHDPNPIHFDLAAVAAAGLGDREVNQGGATMAYIYDMLIAWTGSRRAVRRMECRFQANVFAGDRVIAGGVVTAVRATSEGRVADCDVWVDAEGGERAISGSATVLLRRG